MPVSTTWISTSEPRRLAPISTLPERVYLMALETRFCSSRRNRLRSVITTMLDGTMRRRRFFSRASGWKSVPIWRSRPSRLKTVACGFMAPASRREMSSTAPRIASTESSAESMLAAASLSVLLCVRSISDAQ